MKTKVLIVGLLTVQAAAAATPNDIAVLKAQSQNDVRVLESANRQQLIALKGEAESLQAQLQRLRKAVVRGGDVTLVSVVIAAPLLAFVGYGVWGISGTTNTASGLGPQIADGIGHGMSGLVAAPGTISLGSTVYKAYRISLPTKEIPVLQTRVGRAQEKLTQALQKK